MHWNLDFVIRNVILEPRWAVSDSPKFRPAPPLHSCFGGGAVQEKNYPSPATNDFVQEDKR